MKKNILAIGMISLFIGMAVLPTCSALPPIFYIKAHIEGTVNGLHREKIFGVHGHGPINLAVETWRGKTYINWNGGRSLSFSARFAKLETFDPENNYIKGTVYLCVIKDIES